MIINIARWALFGILITLSISSYAQSFLEVTMPGLFRDEKVRLEYYEYLPKDWNGQVIVMSHGSTGGNPASIKTSFKHVAISRMAMQHGFIFFAFNRKGRGLSEGTFSEETGRCDHGSLTGELDEAVIQLRQVVKYVREKHKVEKVVLMGHSRGGFLSSHYAGKFPEEASAVVNLAGAWSATCEQRNGGFGRHHFEASAKVFKNQFWIYFDNDSFFVSDRFGDPNYAWLKKTAEKNQLEFFRFSDGGRPDGHQAPTWVPKEWGTEIFPRLTRR